MGLYENSIEVRVYYIQTGVNWCKNSSNLNYLMRLLNFINARICPQTADGVGGELYEPNHFHTQRVYMTENDCYDITLTTVMNYDFYEVATLETEDYITACCRELLNELASSIFFLPLGEINWDQAICSVKNTIIEEKD